MGSGNKLEWLLGQSRIFLEDDVLPTYLPRCRWFGGKSRSILKVQIQDWIPAPDGSEWALLFLRVDYQEGTTETYLLPIAQAKGEQAKSLRGQIPAVIMAEPDANTVLYEAEHNLGFRTQILRIIATGGSWPGQAGTLSGHPRKDAFQAPIQDGPETSHVLKVEQSHTSLIYPGRFYVKILRKLEEGENPELEILRFLDEQTSFRNAPPFAGGLEYKAHSQTTYSFAVAEGLIEHQGDAWNHTLKAARQYIGGLKDNGINLGEVKAFKEESALGFAGLLGRRTAEMHLALASRPNFPAFAPEPLSREDLQSLHQGMGKLVDSIFQTLSQGLPSLSEKQRNLAQKVLDSRPTVIGAFVDLLDRDLSLVKIRLHGDYHLGQVLFTGKDVVILDFEGEPARSLTYRRMKQSPWRDVASMVRSFHYAIHSAWSETGTLSDEERKTLAPWAEPWFEGMANGFVEAYLKTASKAPLVSNKADWQPMLRAYLMEKAVYELGYELNNRPTWAHIPLLGILRQLTSPARN